MSQPAESNFVTFIGVEPYSGGLRATFAGNDPSTSSSDMGFLEPKPGYVPTQFLEQRLTDIAARGFDPDATRQALEAFKNHPPVTQEYTINLV